MARENRISVPDTYYNITARCANRAFNLRDARFRDRIADWIYGVAGFSGVEVLSWAIMENHLHLFVHVPTVPERYWLDKSKCPASHAFTQRPRECRAPRYEVNVTDAYPAITPAGDSPSEKAVVEAIVQSRPLVIYPRVDTAFTMSDEDMVRRLKMLHCGHSATAAIRTAKRWRRLRENGRDDEVDAEKDALCRRMYNVSEFMKTLKQRISQTFNSETGHTGVFWESRFYSAVVEKEDFAFTALAGYIALNPTRAGIENRPGEWAWSSWGCAVNPSSRHHRRAVAGYRRLFGDWAVAKAKLEGVFAAKLPPEYDPAKDRYGYDTIDTDGKPRHHHLTLAQLVHTKISAFERGGFISRNAKFRDAVLAMLPNRFPARSAAAIALFAKLAQGSLAA